ncbi:hypothetical protein ZIOFF_042261 [Zingiber officinale]|uniref:RNase H type-1 domain-containing protein n=1 Tax=Zingiber officinale TaxID=94328 RepID=A0A8J5GF33_ZINOF|nr:hypothetical protein ZIOFF_042261 [Zingiber officinale]
MDRDRSFRSAASHAVAAAAAYTAGRPGGDPAAVAAAAYKAAAAANAAVAACTAHNPKRKVHKPVKGALNWRLTSFILHSLMWAISDNGSIIVDSNDDGDCFTETSLGKHHSNGPDISSSGSLKFIDINRKYICRNVSIPVGEHHPDFSDHAEFPKEQGQTLENHVFLISCSVGSSKLRADMTEINLGRKKLQFKLKRLKGHLKWWKWNSDVIGNILDTVKEAEDQFAIAERGCWSVGVSFEVFVGRTISVVHWRRPDLGIFKINTNDCSKGNSGTSYGVIIRDHGGQVIMVKHGIIGVGSNVRAELVAILKGLELCLENIFFPLWLES